MKSQKKKKSFRRRLRYVWAWFWQTCKTCQHLDEGLDCAECQICIHGKPRWNRDEEAHRGH